MVAVKDKMKSKVSVVKCEGPSGSGKEKVVGEEQSEWTMTRAECTATVTLHCNFLPSLLLDQWAKRERRREKPRKLDRCSSRPSVHHHSKKKEKEKGGVIGISGRIRRGERGQFGNGSETQAERQRDRETERLEAAAEAAVHGRGGGRAAPC